MQKKDKIRKSQNKYKSDEKNLIKIVYLLHYHSMS